MSFLFVVMSHLRVYPSLFTCWLGGGHLGYSFGGWKHRCSEHLKVGLWACSPISSKRRRAGVLVVGVCFISWEQAGCFPQGDPLLPHQQGWELWELCVLGTVSPFSLSPLSSLSGASWGFSGVLLHDKYAECFLLCSWAVLYLRCCLCSNLLFVFLNGCLIIVRINCIFGVEVCQLCICQIIFPNL